MFADVFDEGLGLLEGEYYIRFNESVQHTPDEVRSPFTHAKIKEGLDEIYSSVVIEQVTKPTSWTLSMLAVSNSLQYVCP